MNSMKTILHSRAACWNNKDKDNTWIQKTKLIYMAINLILSLLIMSSIKLKRNLGGKQGMIQIK